MQQGRSLPTSLSGQLANNGTQFGGHLLRPTQGNAVGPPQMNNRQPLPGGGQINGGGGLGNNALGSAGMNISLGNNPLVNTSGANASGSGGQSGMMPLHLQQQLLQQQLLQQQQLQLLQQQFQNPSQVNQQQNPGQQQNVQQQQTPVQQQQQNAQIPQQQQQQQQLKRLQFQQQQQHMQQQLHQQQQQLQQQLQLQRQPQQQSIQGQQQNPQRQMGGSLLGISGGTQQNNMGNIGGVPSMLQPSMNNVNVGVNNIYAQPSLPYSMNTTGAAGGNVQGMQNNLPGNVMGAPQLNTQQQIKANSVSQNLKSNNYGQSILRLIQYSEDQRRRPEDNSIDYWRKFIAEYYEDNALVTISISKSNLGDMRCFEPCFSILPYLMKVKYDSGLKTEHLIVENPREFIVNKGTCILDSSQTSFVQVYDRTHVWTHGHLRVTFSLPSFKIRCWQFSSRSNEEEYIPRSMHGQELQPSPINEYGLAHQYARTLLISEVAGQMKDVMDHADATKLPPRQAFSHLCQQIQNQKQGSVATEGKPPTGGGLKAEVSGSSGGTSGTSTNKPRKKRGVIDSNSAASAGKRRPRS